MVTEITINLAPYGVDQSGNPHKANKTQEMVLDWVDNVRAGKHKGEGMPILYLQGGVGSGKTRALVAPAIEMLEEIKDLRLLWGRQDFNDLRLSAMETFFEVFPPEMIAKKNVQEHRYVVKQDGGDQAQIFFRGLKDLGGLGSQEFGVIIVTEAHEISEQAYRTIKMRCRQSNVPNMILMEGNPPNKEHWLAKFTDQHNEHYDPDIEMWEVSTYENWKNLPKAYTTSLERMPVSWKNKYLFGHFGFMPDGKPFYDGFNEQLHQGEYQWNPYKDLICGWDFGYHHPAIVFSQIDDYDRWVILKELMGTDITINKFAERYKSFTNQHFPNASVIHFGDPSCQQVNDKSEQTSWQILAANDIFVQYRQSQYRLRKEIVENKLASLVHGKPQMLVDKSCRTIIDGFLGGYHYPTIKENQQFKVTMEQPFRDGYYEHLMNAMEYIAVNLFSPINKKVAHKKKRKYRGVDNL